MQEWLNACLVAGPKPLNRDVQPRYRAGVKFSLDINGVGLQPDPVIGFAPALNVLDNRRYTCRSPDKEVLGRFVGTVSEDKTVATFTDAYIPFTIAQGLLCWCPGGPCLDAADFTVQLGRYSVAGMEFTPLQADSFLVIPHSRPLCAI